MKLAEKEKSSTTRVCVMGLSGTGKSTLVSKLAEKFKLYWFTLDNDADVLLKLPPAWQENIELYDLPDSAVFPVACETLLKLFKAKGKGYICHQHGIFNCLICPKQNKPISQINFQTLGQNDIVVIDTGSQLAMSALAHSTKDQEVTYKPEWDDWGAVRKWTEFFASEFQAAKFNLVVTFHCIETALEDEREKMVPAFGSKDMSTKVAKAFSHIVYCDVKNRKHVAYSSSTWSNTVLTKSRTDFKIEDLGEPSLIPIFEKKIPATKMESEPEPVVQISSARANLQALLKKGTTT